MAKRRFTCIEDGVSKFWEIEVSGTSFTTTYGKIGYASASTTKNWADEETCQKEATKILNSKVKKGYKEDGVDGQADDITVLSDAMCIEKSSMLMGGKLSETEKAEVISAIARRPKVRAQVIMSCGGSIISELIRSGINLTIVELHKYLDHYTATKDAMAVAVLVDYKSNNFTKAELEKFQTNKEMVDVGLERPTFKQLQEKWKCSKGKDGIIISGYKGTSTKEIVPGVIDDGTPIVCFNRGGSTYHDLEEVIFDEGIKAIGDGAFTNCMSLKRITIPSTVTLIGSNAFKNCYGLRELGIPNSVEEIGAGAFESCCNVISMVIPSSVKEIGEGAFRKCDKMETIDIQEGVEKIGNSVFSNCKSLVNLNIPTTVKEFGRWQDDKSPKIELTLAKDTSEELAKSIFKTMSPAKTMLVPGGKNIKMEDGVLLSADGKKLLRVQDGKAKSVVIPDSVETICDYAFARSNMVEVKIGSGVKTISKYAFYGCRELFEVVIPDNVVTIGSYAFEFCDKLSRVVIGDGVEVVGDHSFSSCYALLSVTVGKKVKDIQDAAFFWNSCIVEVYNLSKLKMEVRSNDHGYLTNNALEVHTSLDVKSNMRVESDFVIYSIRGKEVLVNYMGKSSKVEVPDGVQVIHGSGFNTKRQKMVSIKLPDSIIEIQSHAFFEFGKLQTINIPKSVQRLGYGVFHDCNNLTVHCEASSSPEGWDRDWNKRGAKIVWNSKGK